MKNSVNVNAVQYNIYVILLGKTFAIAALKCKMIDFEKLDKDGATLTKPVLSGIFFFWNGIVRLISAASIYRLYYGSPPLPVLSSLCSSLLIYTKLREIVFNIFLPGELGSTLGHL